MKKSSVYEIAVKILGLYLFIHLIDSVAAVFNVLVFWYNNIPEEYVSASQLAVIIFNLLIITCAAVLLTFKTRFVVKKISTPEDYEEDAKLFAEKKSIYEMAMLITGLIVLVWTIPDFTHRFYTYIKDVQNDVPVTFPVLPGIKCLLAIVLIWQCRNLAAWFAGKES